MHDLPNLLQQIKDKYLQNTELDAQLSALHGILQMSKEENIALEVRFHQNLTHSKFLNHGTGNFVCNKRKNIHIYSLTHKFNDISSLKRFSGYVIFNIFITSERVIFGNRYKICLPQDHFHRKVLLPYAYLSLQCLTSAEHHIWGFGHKPESIPEFTVVGNRKFVKNQLIYKYIIATLFHCCFLQLKILFNVMQFENK